MLELKNVSKSYKANRVLENVDLTVNDGEMVALLGPSGSGKTTILRLVAGFIDLNGGDILVDGENVENIPAHKRNIGVVFQDYALFPHMTVEQNVRFGLKMHKVPEKEASERMEAALALVGLQDYKERYPSQLSGGQQQRVAIARVVAIRSKVMLLDEPLSNLDAKMRRQVRVELRELQQKLGITTLIVTHDQEEAMTMGDRIAILEDGEIQQIGAPMELYQKPCNRFVAGFLGTPSINFFECKVGENESQVAGFPVDLSALGLAPGEYDLGVRPEDLMIAKEGDAWLKTQVKMVEHLGSETLVYFELDGTKCCKTEMDASIARGQELGFAIDPARVSIFDKTTGKRI